MTPGYKVLVHKTTGIRYYQERIVPGCDGTVIDNYYDKVLLR